MVGTRAFMRNLTAPEHIERGNELLLIADQWMNIQHFYRADACATLAVAHYYAATMGGDIADNPRDERQPETIAQHSGRALALITGAENSLARQNYAQSDALASVAVSHYVCAHILSGSPDKVATAPQPILREKGEGE